MALDRPVVLRIYSEASRNEHDEFVPGAPTDRVVWTEQADGGVSATFSDVDTVLRRLRTFTVRWRPDLEAANPLRVELFYKVGDTWLRWNAQTIGTVGRQRFVEISAIEQAIAAADAPTLDLF